MSTRYKSSMVHIRRKTKNPEEHTVTQIARRASYPWMLIVTMISLLLSIIMLISTVLTASKANADSTDNDANVNARATTLPVYDLKTTPKVPVQYGRFSLNLFSLGIDHLDSATGFTRSVDDGTADGDAATKGNVKYKPNKNGAILKLKHVGQWLDSNDEKQWINLTITVNSYNDGFFYWTNAGSLIAGVGHKTTGKTARNTLDMSVAFTLDNGNTPTGFKGVTGFTDLDGLSTGGDNEGWELISGFDGVYVRSDAHLNKYGTNGWRGYRDENEKDTDEHGMKHYLGATFNSTTLRVRYSNAPNVANGSSFMPLPATVGYKLSYDSNGGIGEVPSNKTSGSTIPAADSTVNSYDGCQVYYPAGVKISLATAVDDDDCWDSSMLTKTNSAGKMQFLGWSEKKNQDVYTADEAASAGITSDLTMPASDKTVYAVWANLPILRYDVNAPVDTESPTAPNDVAGVLTKPFVDSSGWKTGDTTKIKGYKFLGWYTSTQDGSLYDWSTPATSAETTVYAHWQAIDYTIHYNGNKPVTAKTEVEGSMTDQKLQYDAKSNLKKNVYTLKGWKWTGWNDRADGTGTSYVDEQEIVNLIDVDGNEVTLYAQWTPVPVKIIYDANGGQGSHDPTTGNAYDLLTIPTDADGKTFTRTDYRFLGWFTEPDSKTSTTGRWYYPDGSKDGDTQVQMEDHDVTLYAQWETTVPIPGDRVGLPRTGRSGLLLIAVVFVLGIVVSVSKAFYHIKEASDND